MSATKARPALPKKAATARRVVVITGASSGIGEAAAVQLAAPDTELCLVARREDELRRVQQAVEQAGGHASIVVANLADSAGVEACIAAIRERYPAVEVLVNNAGRSIRRLIVESLDRPHDFERTMQLNYFAPVRLTLGLLPGMLSRGRGQIVNVSSVAALMTTPRFSAYLASKSALDAFSRSLRIELAAQGIAVTSIHFPLVKTAMTEPTAIYKYLPQMEVAEAARWIVEAIEERPARRAQKLPLAFHLATAAAPGPALRLLGEFYRRRVERLRRRLEADRAPG